MSERFQTERFDASLADITNPVPELPEWLAERLLRPDEEITWVRGPRFNPSWERYVTNPALFIVALIVGLVGVGIGRILTASEPEAMIGMAAIAGAIVLASIFVLGISSGYFTRLVVTNSRLVILQGYEVCRSWDMDDLPPHLIRYGRPGGDEESPAVDLEAVKTMLGGSSNQFTDAKTILSFGKQLEQIKTKKKHRP
jgi:low affinity Fe/Cu permease